MLEIAVFQNINGQRNYGLVLSKSENGMIEVLWDPFDEFPDASFNAKQSRVSWILPDWHERDGTMMGTRLYAAKLSIGRIAWATQEIEGIIAIDTYEEIERMKPILLRKYSATKYRNAYEPEIYAATDEFVPTNGEEQEQENG